VPLFSSHAALNIGMRKRKGSYWVRDERKMNTLHALKKKGNWYILNAQMLMPTLFMDPNKTNTIVCSCKKTELLNFTSLGANN
jgi:glucan-binding YG repeat protein